MNPELVGWQILTAVVLLGGDLVYWLDRSMDRSHAQMCRNIARIKARRRSGGVTQAGSAPPAVAAPHGPGVTRSTAHPVSPPDHQAPVGGGDVPAVLPSTGPTPAGAAATPPIRAALAGPHRWWPL